MQKKWSVFAGSMLALLLGGSPALAEGPGGRAPMGSEGGRVNPMDPYAGQALQSPIDRQFIEKAASGGLAEVKLGQLAAQQSSDPRVKAFAQHMIEDHSKANDELKALCARKHFTPPTSLTTKDQGTYDNLAKKTGRDFDRSYLDAMVKDHDEDVREFQKASREVRDPDLKAWAEKTLPTLQMHDDMAHHDRDMK